MLGNRTSSHFVRAAFRCQRLNQDKSHAVAAGRRATVELWIVVNSHISASYANPSFQFTFACGHLSVRSRTLPSGLVAASEPACVNTRARPRGYPVFPQHWNAFDKDGRASRQMKMARPDRIAPLNLDF
jgi:hypothetical protein